MKDMLGLVKRKIVDLPFGTLGTLYDLVEKLLSAAGQNWLAELEKFLRKEECWTSRNAEIFLNCISGDDSLSIDAYDPENLAEENEPLINSNCEAIKWCINNLGERTSPISVKVYEIIKDGTFIQLLISLSDDFEKLSLTPFQIKNFVKKHTQWLSGDKEETLFLLKSHQHFFIIGVRVYILNNSWFEMNAHSFGWNRILSAGSFHRIVVPQLQA